VFTIHICCIGKALQPNVEIFLFFLFVLPWQPNDEKTRFFLLDVTLKGHNSNSKANIKNPSHRVAEQYKYNMCAKFGDHRIFGSAKISGGKFHNGRKSPKKI